jgi:hypothetical protein
MMWTFEHELLTEAKAESIWKLYSDITTWTEWDKGIENAVLFGAFQAGTKGQLQPRGRNALDFEIISAEPYKGFSDITEMPGAGLIVSFDHELQSSDKGTIVKHRVTLSGPKANSVDSQFGEHFKKGIPLTMAALVKMALELE